MPLVNHANKELSAKIVYYGPADAGKAASLRYLYGRIRPQLRGELKSVPVIGSSLLFFDFTPFEQPVIGDYRIRFHIYTLPGRVDNPASWKMILKGMDALVIVSDAAPAALRAGRQSLAQLREILGSYGVGLDDIPAVLQLNRAEQSDRALVESAVRELGLQGCRVCPASPAGGEGVLETLTVLSRLLMGRLADLDGIPQEPSADLANTKRDSTPVCPDASTSGSDPMPPGVSPASAGESTSGAVAVSPGVGEISVEGTEVSIDGGKVKIPLIISTSDGGRQRLVVTVMVSAG